MNVTICLLVLLFVWKIPTASAQSLRAPAGPTFRTWTTFLHPRFNYKLPIPPGVRSERNPEVGNVAIFVSRDHQFEMSAWSRYAQDTGGAQFEEEWRLALRQNGRRITYHRKAASWFVVSGTDSAGIEFYEKCLVRGRQVAGFRMTYSRSLLSVFEPWVERIEDGFALVNDREKASAARPRPGESQGAPQNQPRPNPKEPSGGKTSDNPAEESAPPIAEKVIGKPGFVYSPFKSDRTLVDVTDIPSGTKVKCPHTMKIFRVP